MKNQLQQKKFSLQGLLLLSGTG